ncbi:MAG: glutathione S-transferase family protein [Cognatishimia sp.]
MIMLYTWPTPNGLKVSIMLEELGIEYLEHPIDIHQGAQHSAEFAEISPTRKIPVLRDSSAGVTLIESNAILLYLAEKHRRFLPLDPLKKIDAISWLMWQGAALGPMAGQANFFHFFNPGKSEFAEEKFLTTVRKLYGVLEDKLLGNTYICGDYSIVDMACYPWIARHTRIGIQPDEYPNVFRWYETVGQRAAVRKAFEAKP